MRSSAACAAALALVVVGCGDDDPGTTPARVAEVVADGLSGPTQFVVTDDGDWLVAELNGDENARNGRVVRVDADTGDVVSVLLDGLDKPTGIALLDGYLWVMQRRSLGRAMVDPASGVVGDLDIVVADLPYNGRSEGTLTVTPRGTLLYATTGAERAGDVVAGSGTLWELDPASAAPVAFAAGLKNAYAHVAWQDGTVTTTEIGDGTYDGVPPFDEVVVLARGDDAGWPTCDAQGRPVRDRGGSIPGCDATVLPLVTFAPQATPTGIAALPDDRLAVALWVLGEVVVVDQDGTTTTWLTELARPQHLLVDGDRLLASDHAAGTIVAIPLATAPGNG